MRQIVLDNFWDYTETFESLTLFPYDDVKGLVTIGPGLLCSKGLLLSLPCTHPDGSPATHDEIEVAWDFLDSPAGQATDKQGGAHYANLTSIRVTREGIKQAGVATLSRFENQLRQYLKNWDEAGASAQLAALSHAWAFGGLFPATWPNWTKAFNAGSFGICAQQDSPSPGEMLKQNASFHKRIATEQALLFAADTVPPDQIVGWPT